MAHKRNSVEVPELEKLLAGKKRNTFATRKGQSSTRWAKTLSDKSHRMLTLSSG